MKNITTTSSQNHLGSHHLILEVAQMRNHNPVGRFFALPPNRKMAIEAMCASCMGCTKDHLEEGFKSEIRKCSAPHCPLYPLRPYQVIENIPPK